ncbi:MAG: rhodanese-like domain-containing protein [Bacteroidetes bacterium]|nr:rhodanese-like domain-containing protein [Bacteroidota bacterium]
MKEKTVSELKKMKDENQDFQLIDVREAHEFDIAQIGGELIPMGDVMDNVDRIAKDKPVIIHCRSGARSAAIVQALETQHGFTNLYNLKGGILAWANEIDTSMNKY